ncbi:MAG: 50S ribosomal protein L29 [Candidatus Bathyarchaeia archaeon]
MPILRMKEINSMSSEDRAKKLSELRAELSRLRTMISAGGAVENPARVRDLRKTIAQILTVETEYQKGIRKSAAEPKKAEPKKAKAPAKPKEAKEKKPE